ncbi:Protein FAR1-RELATED SEQUENCE 7 [Platanthera zijinensis]|uniref:Protein FAR1-RELATED SEQUENCE 7 n=1 Tax=Platanthera zijinensis TaxID=2320716 RepID=A0AAP0B0M3_9ASPA
MYCDYAHKKGFSVRKAHVVYWIHTRIIKFREYKCSKAGYKRSKEDLNDGPHVKFHKLDTRTGCLACIHFSVDKEGKNWMVERIVEEHNHPLAVDNEAHLLRSHRKISRVQVGLLKNMVSSGIRTVHAYNFLADQVGGYENVGFCKSDAYNYVQREKKALIESGDSLGLLKIFKDLQMNDSMFSYDVRTDDFNRLTSFIWMDGHSKVDYDSFGDVIIFDTTYRLNKYNLACAPFIAVNHHWQNVFVGGAFLAEETIDAFCWLFETFLRFVGGKQPSTIFTDQDQAMAVAISKVFYNSRHRLCQWHISKKAPSKVPAFNQDPSIRGLFYQCMSKCDTDAEFDVQWTAMISRGNLEENRWLCDLCKIKHKWSTAYNKEIIDLGILSTQRSESANNGLHGCSKATSSLVECYHGVDKLISSWRRSEHEEDFKCRQGKITIKAKNCLLLKQASKLYTRKMYHIFEETYTDGALNVNIVHEVLHDDDQVHFATTSCDGGDNAKHWVVSVNVNTLDANCSCKGFETRGILCKHILRVYNSKNVKQIPSQYFLRRFTLMAKQGLNLTKSICLNDSQSNLVLKHHLLRFTYDLATRIENCQIAKEHVLSVMTELAKSTDKILLNEETLKKGYRGQNAENIELRDPAAVRPKGVSNARLKSHFEKPKKKPSKCFCLKFSMMFIFFFHSY